MGAFIVIIVTMLTAIWMALSPYGQDTAQINPNPNRPALQAVAANMIEFHQAVVNFVTMTQNKTPASTMWQFTYASQAAVRCSGSYSGGLYPANSVAGTCSAPATELPMPSFLNSALPVYDWVVCYASGSQNIVVTYSRKDELPGGYTPTEVAAALADYGVSDNHSNWYWGVVKAGPQLDTPSTLALPTTCTSIERPKVSDVAIATVIP